MRTIIEPFRIKMTEPLKITTRAERVRALEAAHHNVFLLDAEDCCIDLLTKPCQAPTYDVVPRSGRPIVRPLIVRS